MRFYGKVFFAGFLTLALFHGGSAWSGNLTLVGYTTTYTGNLGGVKGANAACDSAYPGMGSRAMTYNDFLSLGTSYTYVQAVWLIDGASMVHEDNLGFSYYTHISKDGNDSFANTTDDQPMCIGWNTGDSGRKGPSLSTSGIITLDTCNSSRALACVR